MKYEVDWLAVVTPWRFSSASMLFPWSDLPEAVIRGAFLIWVGWLLIRGPGLPGRHPLGWLLLAGGAHFFDYLVLGNKAWGLTLGLAVAQFLAIGPSTRHVT